MDSQTVILLYNTLQVFFPFLLYLNLNWLQPKFYEFIFEMHDLQVSLKLFIFDFNNSVMYTDFKALLVLSLLIKVLPCWQLLLDHNVEGCGRDLSMSISCALCFASFIFPLLLQLWQPDDPFQTWTFVQVLTSFFSLYRSSDVSRDSSCALFIQIFNSIWWKI